MAIKVYKGGSWVNATGVSAIGKADRLAIGQTNTSLTAADKSYYLSFVDDNHPHTSRQYEDFYTGIGITFSPITNALSVDGVLYLNGQEDNSQGSIWSKGGVDKRFVLYNNSNEGETSIVVANSSGSIDTGIATFKRGAAAADDDSYFRSNVSPPKDCTGIYNLGKPDEKWNNVYANCFHGDGTGLIGTGSWDDDDYKNLKAGTCAGNAITAQTCYNIFVGAYAGCKTTGAGGAGGVDEVGDANVFLGVSAGRNNITGSYNFYGGYLAGRGKDLSSPSGCCNIFIGRSAGQEITSGKKNVFLGSLAGEAIDTGDNNIFLGLSAGRHASSASQSVAIGLGAGFCNITANNNTFLGTYAGRNVTSGGNNVAIGFNALRGEQSASGQPSCDILGIQNVAVGYAAGRCIGPLAADQGANTFLGAQAACTQLDGSFNVAIGYQVQLDLTTCTNVSCVSNQLAIGAGSNRWLTGDKSFNIRPGKGIIDCSGSCGTEGQVLTSHKVAGTPDNYYVKWNTNASQATNADKIGIGTTTNAGGDNLQSYYVPFVRENNDHNNRQYEQLYSDSRLVFNYNASADRSFVGIGTTNPRAAILHLESNGPILRLTDRDAPTNNRHWHIATNLDGILRLQAIDDSSDNDGGGAGGGDHFDFYREDENITEFRGVGAGITWFVVDNKNLNVGIGTSNPSADDINTSLQTNTSVLAVGIVTAREYYGTFKGIIDPGATVTLDKIQEGDTSAEVVDTGTDGHFKVLTDGTERLRIDDAGISTFSSDVALIARFQRIGNTDGKWAKVDIKANTTDGNSYLTFSDSAATEVGAINYEHNDDTLRFEVWDRDQTNPQRRSRLQIGNLGQIGLYDDTSGTSNDYGDSDDVLTSQGPNAKPIWKAVSGIPASTSVQVKVTKVNDDTRYYLTGVTATNTGEATTVDKTLYQNMPGAPKDTHLYMKPSSGMLFLKNIRGDIVDPTGKTWPETNGDLKIVTSNFIPDTNSTTVDSNGNPTNGQNLGGPSNKFATVYAQKFDGLLGGTADKAKQLEVQKNESSGTGHYFGMITGAGDNGTPSNQTFYTDTALTYNPSSDILTAPNIKVTTLLNVEGNTILGDQLSDTVTWNARSGVILPTGTPDATTSVTPTDLGSAGYKWNTVYAETFSGAFQGIAEKADLVKVSGSNQNKDLSLTFIDWNDAAPNSDSDPAYKGLKFDVERNLTYNSVSNVLTVPNLAISGITTLGTSDSDKTIFNSKVDSNIVPAPPASGQDKHTLGSPSDYWGNVYADSFTGSMSGSATKVNTQKANDIDGFVTFVETNHDASTESTVYTNSLLTYNSTANSEILTVDCQLDVTGDATLGSGDINDKVTFNSKIAAPLTLGIGQILPFTVANEAKTAGIDLGGSSAYWKTIYAREFKGAITGNATSASALDPGATINLTTGSYTSNNAYSGIDFNSTASTAFTGSIAYTITSALNTTGVTAGEYGSTTTIPKIKVDSKGRISSVLDQSISLTGLTADKAKQLEVTERTNFANDYIPFVIGSPTATATAKTFYADSNLRYRSASDMLITSKISSDGSFPSAAGKIATTKEISSGVYSWEWGDGTAAGIGRNYTLPLTVSGNTATWTLTDNVTPTANTNPIALTAGAGLKISSSSPGTTGGSFTISMDTSSNTAFKYKNTYASNAETTNKADAVLQIYPSGGNAEPDQKITIKPGTGIKFSAYGAQTLTIESDADVGASTVDLTKTSTVTHDDWHFIFADSRDGGSETLYVNDDANPALVYKDNTSTLQTVNLYVAGSTTLGSADGIPLQPGGDTVTWNARSSTILPQGTLTNNVATGTNLGSANCKWDNIYAKNITGTLTVDTSDKQVLYTSGTGVNAVVAGADNFTWDMPSNASGVLKVSRNPNSNPANEDNWAAIITDGALEITRTHATTFNGQVYKGGAYIDFRDDPDYTHDYIARMQVTTHMAGGLWNQNNDRGGLLFETGGTGHRHMLLTKDGVLGITTGTNANAIKTNNGTDSHRYGFVPGIPRDTNLNDAHNINNQVVLDVNGTIMLRANNPFPNTVSDSRREGGQIVFNNSEDTVGFSIDVYGTTAGNSTLRIIDEKTPTDNRGTQRFAMNRSGAITFEPFSGTTGNSNANVDYGTKDVDVLTSQGHDGHPIWAPVPAGASALKTKVRYHTGGIAVYTPTTNTKFIRVQVIGPGGGGGGLDTDSDSWTISGSGGGGGYCESYITIAGNSNLGTMVYQNATGGAGGSTGGSAGTSGGIAMFWTSYGTANQICMQACGGQGGQGSYNADANQISGNGGNALYVKGTAGTGGVISVEDSANPPSGGALPTGLDFIYLSKGAPGVNNYTTKKRYPGPPAGIQYQSYDLDGGGFSGMGGGTYGRGGNGCTDQYDSWSRAGGNGTDGIVIVTEFGDF